MDVGIDLGAISIALRAEWRNSSSDEEPLLAIPQKCKRNYGPGNRGEGWLAWLGHFTEAHCRVEAIPRGIELA